MSKRTISLLGLTAMCLFALGNMANLGVAQDDSNDRNQDRATQQTSGQQRADKLIKWLDKEVDLSNDQKQQIKEIAEKNEEQMQTKWQSLQQAQAQAIELEAMMLASMQDQMTESQKEEFREGHQARQNQAKQSKDNRGDQNRNNTASNDRDRSDRARNRDSQDRGRNDQARTDRSNSNRSQRDSSPEGQYVWAVIIQPARDQMRSQDLSSSQRQMCEQACTKFHQELTDSWKKINQLHEELVRMEAKKLRQVEKVLNDDQLAKLKNSRSEQTASLRNSNDSVDR